MTFANTQFKFSPYMLAIPLYGVLSLWIVYWIEIKYHLNFNNFGIYPRQIKGLRGIIFGPFIHGDIKHLYHNSIPLFVLSLCVLYFYKDIAFKILIWGTLSTGLLTWIIARPSYHIGASGVIYMLFSFVFFSGVIRQYFRLIAVSLLVIFLYGSMVWYLLPVKDDISWEGHTAGFVVGIILAVIYRKHGPQKFKYDWEKHDYEKDEFDLLFDEDGQIKSSYDDNEH